MDFSESTKIVANRIQTLDPENVSKIIGYLLLQDHGEKEMLRLAFGPDTQLLSLISKAKADLGLSSKLPVLAPIPRALIQPSPPISDIPLQFTPFTPVVSRPFSSPTTFQAAAAQYWEPQLVSVDQQQVHALDFVHPAAFADLLEDDYLLHDPAQFLSMEDQIEHVSPVGADFLGNYCYPESTLDSLSARSRRSPSLPEFPIKACHYFKKGYCKHGTNCRYLHGLDLPDSFSQIFIPSSNDLVDKDHVFPPVSLEKLELEIMELLKSRKGMPVSIASLPMMYYEKYGKTLQAEGYLTESQRHGKAGYSLTKLLARLNNSIRLIDRPHGQHSVILAEDAPKYMEYRSERSDLAAVVAGSRQIYLTFPAESTFTEDDVSNYFMSFGPVQDVRIPCQQKRMFGFVTFLFPETVKLILQKGNPHFVCDSRVLVKPYKEKSRLVDRKYTGKTDPPMCCPSHFVDIDAELHSMPRVCPGSRLLSTQLIKEHELMLEFETRRLSELQLAPKQLTQQPLLSFSMEESKVTEACADDNEFNYLLDVSSNGSTSDDKARHTNSSCNDQDSQGINLPESPFASSAIVNSISRVLY
ncbi:zinc finger CCCH domain-containing protein 18-like isoform X2 [Magnolia sinica]|uniref:zinc finger CCCH domain-containing protein 18-like isoform X2 n=1 Tax=Magnolia sinica TaxID=86752 RepID=UPI002659CE8C|nr:zinc finger CCCH domain-containing protein 18-like isoform X2 [Magnolia sinica]XP_058081677.1 zinc finger CCCH domain-containing protein 18-like isoform X2 [Magnolia sinica]